MANVVRGADRVLFMRPLPANGTPGDAFRMAFQTNHEKSSSRDANSTITKDGNVNSLSEVVIEFSLTTLMAVTDTARDALEAAYLAGTTVEFWDVNKTGVDAAAGGQCPAMRYEGFITEWNESAGAEDSVEISLSTAIDGVGTSRQVTLAAGGLSITPIPTP
ncbi:MAG: phage major tail protein, TP901-1 family [Oscillospiraceae bacterium]|nr:phage major tail protein, TP901-1 family [Oscillospiraceae bacterium]